MKLEVCVWSDLLSFFLFWLFNFTYRNKASAFPTPRAILEPDTPQKPWTSGEPRTNAVECHLDRITDKITLWGVIQRDMGKPRHRVCQALFIRCVGSLRHQNPKALPDLTICTHTGLDDIKICAEFVAEVIMASLEHSRFLTTQTNVNILISSVEFGKMKW